MKISLSSVSVSDLGHALDFCAQTLGFINFTQEPTEFDGAKFAVFDDTCGNLIQIYHEAD